MVVASRTFTLASSLLSNPLQLSSYLHSWACTDAEQICMRDCTRDSRSSALQLDRLNFFPIFRISSNTPLLHPSHLSSSSSSPFPLLCVLPFSFFHLHEAPLLIQGKNAFMYVLAYITPLRRLDICFLAGKLVLLENSRG